MSDAHADAALRRASATHEFIRHASATHEFIRHASATHKFIRRASATLKAAACDDPGDDARRLAGAAFGLDRGGLIARGDVVPPASALARFKMAVAARTAGDAVSRVVGRRAFWSFDCPTMPQTLDPRADSETIVYAALDATPADAALRVLDLGCGTGCLLAAFLLARPNATGVAVDSSAPAARYAAALFRALGLADRARAMIADAADWADPGFDVALANPPYLTAAEVDAAAPELRRGDPRGALDGGRDGCGSHRVFAAALARSLPTGAPAVIEIGAAQATAATAVYTAAGFVRQAVVVDGAGRDRGLLLRRDGRDET